MIGCTCGDSSFGRRQAERVLDAHLDEVGEPQRRVEQFDRLLGAVGMQIDDRTPERVLRTKLGENFRGAVFAQVGVLIEEIAADP